MEERNGAVERLQLELGATAGALKVLAEARQKLQQLTGVDVRLVPALAELELQQQKEQAALEAELSQVLELEL